MPPSSVRPSHDPQAAGPDASEADPRLQYEIAYTLLGDQPYLDDGDPLGFDEVADNLASLILRSHSSSPFTLGIEGGWGTGKSTLMEKIQARLKMTRGIKTVWFNAWALDEGQAFEGLVKSVLNELDSNLLRRAARKAQLLSWSRLLVTLASGWLGVGGLVDSIWHTIATDPKARSDLKEMLEEAMERWMSHTNTGSDRLLVVFVDDLDRCSPVSVFQIFEAIKVHLSTPGMVFVVGYDKQIVSQTVLTREQYAQTVTSADYLEKIIQITYRMPLPLDDSAGGVLDTYLETSATTALFSTDPTLKTLAIARNARNPRRIKRFINAFILEWGLDPEWEGQGFHPAVVVRVVILYLYFADFAILLERDDSDPVEKFKRYLSVRETLRRRPSTGDGRAWEIVRQFTMSYDLARVAPSEDPMNVLGEIEGQLPACFRILAPDAEFAQMVDGLGDAEERRRLGEKLRRSQPAIAAKEQVTTPLELAAESGDAAAAATLGLRLEERGEFDAALNWQRAAADLGDHMAMYNLGRMLHERGQDEQAVGWLRQSKDPMAAELLQQISADD